MVVDIQTRSFTIHEFHRMIQAGVLDEDEHVELIEGELVTMSPISSHHASCVDRLNWLFSQKVGRAAIVRVQSPVYLSEYSEPQPDIVLMRFRPDFYAHAHPEPRDVLLVVEIAETSADYDREVKLPLYAQAGIPEVWLVNLPEGHIEVYRQPAPEGYRETRFVQRGQYLSLWAFEHVEWAVDDILG